MAQYVMIYAELDGIPVECKAFTQFQVFTICNQLKKDGAIKIGYDFNVCDKLPKNHCPTN